QVATYYDHPFHPDTGEPISLLPLIDDTTGGYVTNIITATWFVHKDHVTTFGDVDPADSSFDWLRDEIKQVQQAGVKVTMMLLGNWTMLDGNDTAFFEASYSGIHDAISLYGFDGIDLDVEDPIGFDGIVRLIQRLKSDFGSDFIITMAPVASALSGGGSLSAFNYLTLEQQYGNLIAWYNAQFYNGWGSPASTTAYKNIINHGFPSNKVIMGLATSGDTSGFVSQTTVASVVKQLLDSTGIGGISGWDYWDGLPGGKAAPWQWAE
ncbi:glycoside hydrolase, partial [Thozetella sp. PMI_491]